ncbi:MAG TPA: pirin family protein [Planctomycetota bacterium]
MKSVVEIRKAPPLHWVGDGFPVRSMFSYDEPEQPLSPFLLLDYAAPWTVPAGNGEPRGVGEHPHRGFETVTIVYQGEVEHRDSAGHKGRIGPGDVQWMTAASGVVHEEKHGRELTKKGGPIQMAQLWVNLPAKDKMSEPGYQDILNGRIPAVEIPGGSVRVIAGEFRGTRGPAKTHTPVELFDVRLGGEADLEIPEGHSAAALVVDGRLNGAGPGDLLVLSREGAAARVKAEAGSRFLLLAGEPIDEPVVGYGPFVMNSEEEIRQAIRDYQNGKMGHLDG